MAPRPAADVENAACGRERQLLDEKVHLCNGALRPDVVHVDRRMCIKELFPSALLFQRITHLFFEIRAEAELRGEGRAVGSSAFLMTQRYIPAAVQLAAS